MNINESAHDYLIEFFKIVFKRQRMILIFMVTSFALVCLYTFTATPIFMASSQVLIKIGRDNIFVPQVGNFAPENSLEQINSEIELLKSQALAEKVLNSLGVDKLYPEMKNPGWASRFKVALSGNGEMSVIERAQIQFQKALEIKGIRNSRVIEIEFQHPNPGLAAEVVNRYVGTYMDERLRVHQDPQSFAFFDEQTRMLREKIQKAEEKLKSLKTRSEVIEIGQERSLLLRQKSELEASLNDTAGRVEETQRRIAQLKQQSGSVPERIPQGEETESNQLLINTLQSQLVQLELRKKELLNKYTDRNRLVQEVEEQTRGVQQRLADEASRRYGRTRYGTNPSHQQIRDELLRNEVELQAVTAKLKIQKEQVEQYKKRLDQLGDNEIMLTDLQNTLDVDRRNYQLYLTKVEENRIASEMDSRKIANASIIRAALPPLEPIKPNKFINLGLGIVFAVFGSIGLSVGLEIFRDHFERPDEVETALGAPVLATIPHQKR